jgi:hypothetical protein
MDPDLNQHLSDADPLCILRTKLADLAPAIDDVPGRVDSEHCVLRYGLPPVPAIRVVAAKKILY